MKKVAILIDSSFSVKNGEIKDVYVVPMLITVTKDKQDTTYGDEKDIFNDQICQNILEGNTVRTSQPSPGEILKMLDKLTKEYENVYCLCIPSTISGAYNGFKTAASEFTNVKVFDQTMVGVLSKWTILDLAKANEQGKLTEKYIVDYLEKVKDKRAGVMVVPDISQLRKGGRISLIKSLFVKLLKYKLIITLDKSGLKFRDKVRKEDQVLNTMKTEIGKLIPLGTSKIKRMVIFSNDLNDRHDIINEYIEQAKKTFNSTTPIEFTKFPAVITAHAGPNYMAVGLDLE